jgi:hypothetical protein
VVLDSAWMLIGQFFKIDQLASLQASKQIADRCHMGMWTSARVLSLGNAALFLYIWLFDPCLTPVGPCGGFWVQIPTFGDLVNVTQVENS